MVLLVGIKNCEPDLTVTERIRRVRFIRSVLCRFGNATVSDQELRGASMLGTQELDLTCPWFRWKVTRPQRSALRWVQYPPLRRDRHKRAQMV